MLRKIIVSLRRARGEQAGQAFVIVLILLLLGGLIIAPLLTFMGTGLQTGQVFEQKTSELYAADAGIEDGIWQVKYDELQSLTVPKEYSPYDYYTQWDFQLDEQVNEEDVTGTIENVWIPKGFSVPSEAEAEATIGGVGGAVPKAIVTGTVPDTGNYKIKITYNKEQEDVYQYGNEFVIEEIGIWLPPGFEYVLLSSNLEADPFADYYSEPVVSDHSGGQAIVWSFSSVPLSVFPGVQPSDVPMETSVTFEFTARRAGSKPEAQAWVDTNMNLGGGISYTWDADTKIYKITSQAGDTELEARTAKSELREIGGAIAGDYRAVGNTLMTNEYGGSTPVVRDTLLDESDASVSDIPDDAEVQAAYLYWSAWLEDEMERPGPDETVFEDDCSNDSNWNKSGNDWLISSGHLRGHHQGSGSAGDRLLTLQHSLDLSSYSGKQVTVSWEQWQYYYGVLEPNDSLWFAFSGNGGGTWSANIEAFHDDIPATPQEFSYIIPDEYLTANFKMRFYLGDNYGWIDNYEYCYLDNISISVSNAIFYDDCSDFASPPVNWANGSDWRISSGRFEGHHYSGGNRYLTMSDSVDLSAYSGKTVAIAWEQSIYRYNDVDSNDCLKFAFSGNGGSSWSSSTTAFCGRDPVSSYSYIIPEDYLTDDFRLRFYLENFSSSNEYVYIDDITLYETSGNAWADTSAIFKIDGTQVCFDEYGVPQQDDEEINASEWTILENQPGEYSYACFLDVTELVQAFGAEGSDGNHPGNGTYTVGDVYGDTDNEWSYAAWSLIIIYASAETRGHQLYLYDDFIYSTMDVNVDFDGDGEPGGRITGFLVPEQIEGEGDDDDAAKLTCFVGEGDDYYNYDYLKFNGTALSDGRSSNDVWNSWSVGLVEDGIDIDTFHVNWGSNLLEEGDTSAQIDLPTATDSWNLVYIILSFRSDTIAGGAISYLIKN
jgi:hypothetical protein